MKQCDGTIFSSRFEPEDCMRTFSQSESTRLLSSLQGASLSQQHRPQMPQDPGSKQPVSTSTHRQSRAMSHVAPIPSQHISPMMRPNELPQNPISINPLSEMMTATLSVSAECPLPVDAHSRRATNQDNAHQRHTSSVQVVVVS